MISNLINCLGISFRDKSKNSVGSSCKRYKVKIKLKAKFTLEEAMKGQRGSRGIRGELSYLAPLDSENISAPYYKQFSFGGGGGITPQTESNTTPPSPKTEITSIFFYILNFASIIKFKM